MKAIPRLGIIYVDEQVFVKAADISRVTATNERFEDSRVARSKVYMSDGSYFLTTWAEDRIFADLNRLVIASGDPDTFGL